MADAFAEAHRVLKPSALVCVYAHKTTAWLGDADRGLPSTRASDHRGLAAGHRDACAVGRRRAPLRSASSIFLVARPRRRSGRVTRTRSTRTRRSHRRATRASSRSWRHGSDLVIATIGAGLQAFTRYATRRVAERGAVASRTIPRARSERGSLERSARAKVHGLAIGMGGRRRGDAVLRHLAARVWLRRRRVRRGEQPCADRGVELEDELADGAASLARGEGKAVPRCDYRERGEAPDLGALDGSRLIDVLHGVLWRANHRVRSSPLSRAVRPDTDRPPAVAQALQGQALADQSESQGAGARPASGSSASWRTLVERQPVVDVDEPERATRMRPGPTWSGRTTTSAQRRSRDWAPTPRIWLQVARRRAATVYGDAQAFFGATYFTRRCASCWPTCLGRWPASAATGYSSSAPRSAAARPTPCSPSTTWRRREAASASMPELDGVPDPGPTFASRCSRASTSIPGAGAQSMAHRSTRCGGSLPPARRLVTPTTALVDGEEGPPPGGDSARRAPGDADPCPARRGLVYVAKAKALRSGDTTAGHAGAVLPPAPHRGRQPAARTPRWSTRFRRAWARRWRGGPARRSSSCAALDERREPVSGDEVLRVVQRRLFATSATTACAARCARVRRSACRQLPPPPRPTATGGGRRSRPRAWSTHRRVLSVPPRADRPHVPPVGLAADLPAHARRPAVPGHRRACAVGQALRA